MLDFFTAMIIITGGVFACLFWLGVIIAGFIEFVDFLTGNKGSTVTELGDNDYGYDDRSSS